MTLTKPKILFVVDHLNGGGAEYMTLRLAKAFTQRHIHTSILILNSHKSRLNIPDSVEEISLNIDDALIYQNLWKRKKYPVELQQQLQQIIDTHQPDLVVLGFWNGHWLNQFIQAKKIIHWIHGDMLDLQISSQWSRKLRDYSRQWRYPRAFKKLFNGKTIAIVNQDLADRYQKLIPQAHITVIPNGVDGQMLYQGLPINPTKQWDAVFVGRLSSEKQADHAIKAFAQSGLTGRLAVVGDGALKDQLTALVKQLNISDRVDFLGWLAQPATIIQQSRCLILSSRTEGSPLVPAEALTLGIPVVAYACSSGVSAHFHSESLQRGLVSPQDIDQLAARLADVVANPYTITLDDQQRLSIHVMVDSFLALIPETVSTNASSRLAT